MEASSQPFVSVIIPAYNAAGTVRRAIDSALAQTYRAFEIVVIDDGSADPTSEIVRTYGDRVRLLCLPKNRGESGAMNAGIEVAKGEYIAFLDADDEWLPAKLEKQMAALGANPRATMVTCGCRFIDIAGNVNLEFGMPPAGYAKSEIWRALLAATYIAKPCVIARAAALREVGPFDTALLVAADQDMWIRLAMKGEVEFVPEYLTLAHDTPGSLTKVFARRIDRFVLPMIRRHVERRRRDLSSKELRNIFGERYTQIGRNLYHTGALLRGSTRLLQAMGYGYEIPKNLWYLAVASPPAIAAKTLFGIAPPPRRKSPYRQPEKDVASLINPKTENLVRDLDGPPILLVVVDTEAEFDWTGPFLRTHTGVRNLPYQAKAHEIYDAYGVRPIYLVDYAVATQAEGYDPLCALYESGRCEIGAHMQPWENPPFAEELSDRTSFNHNLPAWLQREKLKLLTEAIRKTFKINPISYRAGRYGVGDEIGWILESLGYQIDLSVLPGLDLRARHGPDFRAAFNRPYWFGREGRLLEIPVTAGFAGAAASRNISPNADVGLYRALSGPRMTRLHAPGVFARLGLLERVTLTPEGMSFRELKRLTRTLLDRGTHVFTFNYHSSSLMPGNTPYVRTQADLDHMLMTMDQFVKFFLREVKGVSMTPSEFRAKLLVQTAERAPEPFRKTA